MKTRFIQTVAAVAALATSGVAMVACDNSYYDDKADIKGFVYYKDGFTPIPYLNLDAYDLVFEMKDDYLVSRRIDFTYADAKGIQLNTDATGKFGFVTGDLQLSAEKKVRECTDICVDRDDQTRACRQWYRDCRDVLKTVTYSIYDIENASAKMIFRDSGATVTLTGIVEDHGRYPVKQQDGSTLRTWRCWDKFIAPMSAPMTATKSLGLSTDGSGKIELQKLNVSAIAELIKVSGPIKAFDVKRNKEIVVAQLGGKVTMEDFSELSLEQKAYAELVIEDYNQLSPAQQEHVEKTVEFLMTLNQ